MERIGVLGLVLLIGGPGGVLLAEPGNDCATPIEVVLPAALPYTHTGTTYGYGADYNSTCLDLYDDGTDVAYALTLMQPLRLRIRADGGSSVSLILDDQCPPAAAGEACLAAEADLLVGQPRIDADLVAGTYYVFVDSFGLSGWTDYTLHIEALPAAVPGDHCGSPLVLRVPADLPYVENGGTTCGRGDEHTTLASCAGAYSTGEEVVYQLNVTMIVDVEVVLDPQGTTHSAVVLDRLCPPGGPTCRAWSGDWTAAVRSIECLRLTPGLYALMIDTGCPVDCLASYDLTIHTCTVVTGACCLGESCAGTLAAPECAALAGQWFEGHDCGAFACPVFIDPLPEACATAHVVDALPFAAELATYTAGPHGPPGSCNSAAATVMQNDVWFKYTAPTGGSVMLDVLYQYNGLTAVYGGPDCNNLTELHCLETGYDLPDCDAVEFVAAAGETYWIQIGDYGSGPQGGATVLMLRGAVTGCPGDADCDGARTFDDIKFFVAGLSGESAWYQHHVTYAGQPPQCSYVNCNVNGSGGVSFDDIKPFVQLIGQPCP